MSPPSSSAASAISYPAVAAGQVTRARIQTCEARAGRAGQAALTSLVCCAQGIGVILPGKRRIAPLHVRIGQMQKRPGDEPGITARAGQWYDKRVVIHGGLMVAQRIIGRGYPVQCLSLCQFLAGRASQRQRGLMLRKAGSRVAQRPVGRAETVRCSRPQGCVVQLVCKSCGLLTTAESVFGLPKAQMGLTECQKHLRLAAAVTQVSRKRPGVPVSRHRAARTGRHEPGCAPGRAARRV